MLKGRINRGFTLIELMIVISIIGVLAGIMVPNFMRARSEANLSGCESNLKNISTAIEMYLVRHKTLPSDNMEFLTEDAGGGPCLKSLPKCPSTGTVTYTLTIDTDNPTMYTVSCGGTNHSGCDIPTDYPCYVAGKGLIEH
ncbi:type II secretion system protein [bacterium]|nr:type II secretion system protein [bacterium]